MHRAAGSRFVHLRTCGPAHFTPLSSLAPRTLPLHPVTTEYD